MRLFFTNRKWLLAKDKIQRQYDLNNLLYFWESVGHASGRMSTSSKRRGFRFYNQPSR